MHLFYHRHRLGFRFLHLDRLGLELNHGWGFHHGFGLGLGRFRDRLFNDSLFLNDVAFFFSRLGRFFLRHAAKETREGIGIEGKILIDALVAHIDGAELVVKGVRAIHQHVQVEEFEGFLVS